MITLARAEALRRCIRRWRLPRSMNIFLFGFANVLPEQVPAPVGQKAEQKADAVPQKEAPAAPPKEKRPSPAVERLTYEEIGQRLEEWYARKSEFTTDFSLEQLAEETHLHKSHLLKYFQNEAKQDFRYWKLIRKIRWSQQLLLDKPDLPIADVAFRSGFNNDSNFFRQFRRISGCTPMQWRESNGHPLREVDG